MKTIICEYRVLYLNFVSDIDECARNITLCDPNAFCFNTDGSFSCECVEPFWTGDGIVCSGRNDVHFTSVSFSNIPIGWSTYIYYFVYALRE